MGNGYIDKVNLKELSKEQVGTYLSSLGLPPFRHRQLIHWLYEKRVASIDDISEFSKTLREELKKKAYISELKLLNKQSSVDGATKYLFGLQDGYSIESVLIPDEKRQTLCISSQVGCRLGCKFCLTAKMGFVRNLKAHEIVDQLMFVEKDVTNARQNVHDSTIENRQKKSKNKERAISNIVMMGMGEALDNFDNALCAINRITGLLEFSKRRITLSTAGLVEELKLFFQKAPEVNLAVSLNATTDSTRNSIMPINKKHNISELLQTCKNLPLSTRKRITFEYILIKGVNDSIADSKRLYKLLRGIRAKINLIPVNNGVNEAFTAPDENTILRFQKILHDAGATAFIRKSRGSDILAACGQLCGKNKVLS